MNRRLSVMVSYWTERIHLMNKIASFILMNIIVVAWTVADRPLETEETLQILEQLCGHPMSGWIQQGRIDAIHLSSDVNTNETVETQESVVTDGERFSWNIRIISQDQSPTAKQQRQKDYLDWNQDRTFTWDGLLYTLYFNPCNHAVVYESPTIPVNVTGPLKAGFIPWGEGVFSFESLSKSQPLGKEIQTDDGPRIILSCEPLEDVQIELMLNPLFHNAVLSYTILRSASKTVYTYGNYTEYSNHWVPMNIVIDQYVNDRLYASDDWQLTNIDENKPSPTAFSVTFKDKAFVEQHSPLLEKPVFYRHTNKKAISPLLEKRYMAALKKEVKQQNCGTVAVEQVLSEFGMTGTDAELAPLVQLESGCTSLYQIQEFIQQKGLTCLPVKTTIHGLKQFNGNPVLLHFPAKKHFVLMDRIDEESIWLIDLDRQTFYNSMDIDRLNKEWAGIALVVSDQTVSMGEYDRPVPEPVLRSIFGAADYTCRLVQESVVEACPNMSSMGICTGRYTKWDDYYACQPDADGGFCEGSKTLGGTYAPCAVKNLNDCDTTGEYHALSIRMCTP